MAWHGMGSAPKFMSSAPRGDSAWPGSAGSKGLWCLSKVPSFTAVKPAMLSAAVTMHSYVLTLSMTGLIMPML